MADVNIAVGNDGSNSLIGTAGDDLIYGFDPNGPHSLSGASGGTGVGASNAPVSRSVAAS